MRRYPITLEPDDNGTLLVTSPAFPEVTTFGADEADAIARAIDAIQEAIAARIDAGEDVPALVNSTSSSAVFLPLLATLKVDLYRALRESGTTRAELMRRLGWKRESVDRLFRLDHASRTDQIEAAFKALGRSVSVKIEKAA